MKKTISIITSLVFAGLVNGQNFTDALRYSEMETQGTARYTAMGGSFGALGGEASALGKNPAGIGIYRSSEFTFSAGFNAIDSDSKYRGEIRNDGGLNFNLPNISYIGNYKGDANGWKNYSFGLTYNRITTFNNQSRLAGNSNNSTIIDDYLQVLNNDNPSTDDVANYVYPFGASEAYNVFMINADPTGERSYTTYSEALYGINPISTRQERSSRVKGNQSETAFTFGGNYQDRWFVGGSMGFQRVRYDREVSYKEEYTYVDTINTANFYPSEFTENFDQLVLGTGVNFKFGIIYRLNEAIRLGAAVHSPTFLGLSEEFTFESTSTAVNGVVEESGESFTDFDYQIRTPARFIGSLGYVFLQKASINFEYEYVDYSSAKLNDSQNSPFDFSPENEEIKNTLTSTHNIRFGAEVKEGPFVFRGGVRYDDNPYASSVALNPNEDRITYSLGTGFRSKNYNFDIAYSTFKVNSIDQLYATNPEAARIEEREHNLVFTLGWRW